jgi:hypothetical protein
MIRVTIEIWPAGYKARAREIALMEIANISDLAPVSDYAIRASCVANPISGQPACNVRGTIKGQSRKNSIFDLLAKAAVLAARSQKRKTTI